MPSGVRSLHARAAARAALQLHVLAALRIVRVGWAIERKATLGVAAACSCNFSPIIVVTATAVVAGVLASLGRYERGAPAYWVNGKETRLIHTAVRAVAEGVERAAEAAVVEA